MKNGLARIVWTTSVLKKGMHSEGIFLLGCFDYHQFIGVRKLPIETATDEEARRFKVWDLSKSHFSSDMMSSYWRTLPFVGSVIAHVVVKMCEMELLRRDCDDDSGRRIGFNDTWCREHTHLAFVFFFRTTIGSQHVHPMWVLMNMLWIYP